MVGNLNNKIMIRIKDNEVALEIFERASIKQAEATEQGNYKVGNKCYKEIKKAIDFLKKNNALEILDICLNSHFVGVRLWAAYYLLPIREKESMKILEEIAQGTGIHSLTAETTLSEWRKGNLKF